LKTRTGFSQQRKERHRDSRHRSLKAFAGTEKTALREMNETECGCGCKLTLAQCRINDTSCDISLKIATTLVKNIAAGKKNAPAPATKPVS